jgi:DNA-binding MarR family transcriptional regulator
VVLAVPDDRRQHALHLTASGKKLMTKIGELGRHHDGLMTAGLDTEQRDTLRQLVSVVAERQGLTPYVHPGYGTLGRANSR